MESTSKIQLSLKTISEITARALQSKAVSATELTDGWFNTIYQVTLESSRSVVLKMAPPPSYQVMRYEKHLLESEVEVLRLLQGVDRVPVPEVLAYDSSGSVHDHDYFLMDFVHGSCYGTIRGEMPAERKLLIDTELGAISSRINSVPGTLFGRYRPDHCTADSWPAALLAMVDDLLLDAADRNAELPLPAATIREAYIGAESDLGQVTTPRLVVWDLHPGNVFVSDDSVTGIIDCDRALWGDPLMEFFFRKTAGSSQAFFDGYDGQIELTGRPGSARCLWLYDLYLVLVMVIECSFRGYEPSHVDYVLERFKGVVESAEPGWL
jgi:aminoglycoside phosphotransferase (APT) family kinase protein